jgi:hypothetical protein
MTDFFAFSSVWKHHRPKWRRLGVIGADRASSEMLNHLRNFLGNRIRVDRLEVFGELAKVPPIAHLIDRTLGSPSKSVFDENSTAIGTALFAESQRRREILLHGAFLRCYVRTFSERRERSSSPEPFRSTFSDN